HDRSSGRTATRTIKYSPPVPSSLLLHRQTGPLAAAITLGGLRPQGVRVHRVDAFATAPGCRSRGVERSPRRDDIGQTEAGPSARSTAFPPRHTDRRPALPIESPEAAPAP